MDQLDPQLQDVSPENALVDAKSNVALLQTPPKSATRPSDEHGEHAAFMPSLQYASGNDLSIAHFEPQHAAGGPLRSGASDAAVHQYDDHWPTDTQNAAQDASSMQNANQFAQGDAANQFAQPSDATQYGSAGLMAHQQRLHHDQRPQEQQHRIHQGTPYDRPGASYGTYDGSKPKRKRASPQQLTLLNNIFEMTYFPSSDLRLAIGKELDMVPRSVQIWFQNRRSLWRAKAQQILAENTARREELTSTGMSEAEADAKIQAERAEAAARQIADQRANDAVEYAINGSNGSLAYALHGANTGAVAAGPVDDGSVQRDDEAGAWSVLHAFHQARTGILLQQNQQHVYQHIQPPQMDPQLQQDEPRLDHPEQVQTE